MTALAPQASPQTTPPATPPATKMRLYTEDRVPLGSVLLRVIAGAVVLLIFVMPYVIMLLGSVKSKAEIRSVEPTFFPKEWHWENYLTMWSTPETPLAQNLISTIVIALGATLLVVHVSMPAAYHTARFKFAGPGSSSKCNIRSWGCVPRLAPGTSPQGSPSRESSGDGY